jgi:hypothetical protein
VLPDLRHEIVRCERHGKIGDACAVHYVRLTQTIIAKSHRAERRDGAQVVLDGNLGKPIWQPLSFEHYH